MNNLTDEDNNDLPSFMSEITDEYTGSKHSGWLSNKTHQALIGISVAWFLLIVIYITRSFGWDNILLMMPSEFGGFMAGVILPLAVVWMVVAYVERGADFKNEAKLLRTYMNQLVYPEDGAASTAKAMADAIREQVSELQEATKLATQTTEEIKSELTARVKDFSGLLDILNEYSNKTINELNLGVSSLIENCNFVTSQTHTMTDDFMKCADQVKVQVGDLTVGMTPMLQDLRNMAIMLNDLVNDNQKKISSANEKFEEYTGLFGQLNDNIMVIEKSLATQKSAVEEQAKILDESSKYLDGKLGEYGKLINMEVAAMVENSSTLDDNLRQHIETIQDTARIVENAFATVHRDVEAQNAAIAKTSNSNAEQISLATKMMEDELKKLQKFTNEANTQNLQLQEIAAQTVNKLDSISMQIVGNTDMLKTKAVETIDAFNQVSGNLKTNTQAMIEATTQIAQQAKANNDAISGQNSQFAAYAKQISEAKDSLNDISEILTQSSQQAENTLSGYKQTVKTLSETLNRQIKTAEDAGQKSTELLQQIENQYAGKNLAHFLRGSEEIMAKLESLAVDINHILSPDDEESLWKKYYNGDKAAFVRHMSKSLTKKQIIAIRDEYEKNNDFRLLVDHYINGFDKLIETAKQTDRADALLTMLYSSHIGNVYYLISRALDKVE